MPCTLVSKLCLIIGLAISFSFPQLAHAETEIIDIKPEPYDPYKSFKDGSSLLLDNESVKALGIGALVFMGARQLDEEARDFFGNQKRIGEFSKLGNEVFGTGALGVAIGGGLWLWGDLKDRPYHSHAGQAQIETLLATTVIVSGLKSVTNRMRPDQSGNDALPSAHSAYAFAAATVLNEFYGGKIGYPAYAIAALTAASRMQDDRHWLSDTVGGAAVAIIVGRAFSRSHKKRYDDWERATNGTKATLNIRPKISSDSVGVVFQYDF